MIIFKVRITERKEYILRGGAVVTVSRNTLRASIFTSVMIKEKNRHLYMADNRREQLRRNDSVLEMGFVILRLLCSPLYVYVFIYN